MNRLFATRGCGTVHWPLCQSRARDAARAVRRLRWLSSCSRSRSAPHIKTESLPLHSPQRTVQRNTRLYIHTYIHTHAQHICTAQQHNSAAKKKKKQKKKTKNNNRKNNRKNKKQQQKKQKKQSKKKKKPHLTPQCCSCAVPRTPHVIHSARGSLQHHPMSQAQCCQKLIRTASILDSTGTKGGKKRKRIKKKKKKKEEKKKKEKKRGMTVHHYSSFPF